jgi:hypothetical protein
LADCGAYTARWQGAGLLLEVRAPAGRLPLLGKPGAHGGFRRRGPSLPRLAVAGHGEGVREVSRLEVLLLLDVRAAELVLCAASKIEPAPPRLAEQARRIFNVAAPTTWRGLLWCLGSGLEDRECPEA